MRPAARFDGRVPSAHGPEARPCRPGLRPRRQSRRKREEYRRRYSINPRQGGMKLPRDLKQAARLVRHPFRLCPTPCGASAQLMA